MAKLVAVDELSPHPRLGSTELLPSLTEEEYAALQDSIAESGIKQPLVVTWPEKVILDGHHRWRAARDLGLHDVPVMTEEFASEDAQLRLGVILNVARRQLSREQKREAIAALLKDDPKQSNRSVAKTVGASPTTVGAIREEMEGAGEVSKVDTIVGSDGVEQPATKPARDSADEVGEKAEPLSDIESAALEKAEAAIQKAVDSGHPAFQPDEPADVARKARKEFDQAAIGRLMKYVADLGGAPEIEDDEIAAALAAGAFDSRGVEIGMLDEHRSLIERIIAHARKGGIRVVG